MAGIQSQYNASNAEIHIQVQGPDGSAPMKVGEQLAYNQPYANNFATLSHSSLLSETGTSSNYWSGSENGSPHLSHPVGDFDYSQGDFSGSSPQSSAPASPYSPVSPLSHSMNDISLNDNPVIPAEAQFSRRMSQSELDFQGHPFAQEGGRGRGMPRSAPASRSVSRSQPLSPLLPAQDLGFEGSSSHLSSFSDAPEYPSQMNSTMPIQFEQLNSDLSISSGVVTGGNQGPYFSSGGQHLYPDQLSSSWGASSSHPPTSGLGIAIPSHQQAGHHSSPSLEVPTQEFIAGPIRRNRSYSGSASDAESDTSSGHQRTSSGSHMFSPYSRPDSSPHSPSNDTLLTVPDAGNSLGRRTTVAGSRPDMHVRSSSALSRNRTVAASSPQMHNYSRSLDHSPHQRYSEVPNQPPMLNLDSSAPSAPLFVSPSQTTGDVGQQGANPVKTRVGSDAIESASRARRSEGREAKFKCDICSATFTAKHNLINHTNSHLGIQPYSCDQCNRGFTTKGVLERHRKTCKGAF